MHTPERLNQGGEDRHQCVHELFVTTVDHITERRVPQGARSDALTDAETPVWAGLL